jgi:ubiquinone/menaquinone biosynthesis C-methylase UbiE
MDALLQRRVQRYGWDKAADWYEQYWRNQLEPAQTKLLELSQLQPGEEVLDIACGSGFLSFRMASAIMPGGHITSTDISDRMIEFAAKTAKEKGIPNISFQRMEAEELGFEDERFDMVISSLGLMYVTDAQQSVNEMYRVARSGGRASALVWGNRNACGWAEIFPVVESRVSSEVCPLFFRLGTANTLHMVFEQAGFKDVRTEKMNTLLQYESGDDAGGAAFIGGPVAMAWSRFSDTVKKEAMADYLASIEKFKKEKGYAIPGEFVIVTGTRQ